MSQSTIEGTLRVRSSNCLHGITVIVAAAEPQMSLNGTVTWSILSGTASYETYMYVAGQEESGCVLILRVVLQSGYIFKNDIAALF